ncbi:putative Rab-GTPase-TBC domain-containing protein [Seiridium cardinale]|uniref:Rab-GTPase-TBC domain-containing protein n=1 Tax=Seiridium cardinale TaxID=138064 RepID=A0ABR2Y6N1_9PEZI
MRSLADSTTRWQETIKHSSSLSELQRAVKFNGPNSPCISGCRSICWKVFLLGHGSSTANWTHALLESRSTYASLRGHFLRYIKHPEYLANVNTDPLADDPDSPWNTLRQDETLRAEILQDVQRLPDEPFYHEPSIQTLILDILFIYCKLNPDVGGYRQGMHELLAPIVYVLEQDAINPNGAANEGVADLTMVEMLDANFLEHDAFALFSKLMEHAKVFYETGENSNAGQSTIVEKSQHIHEVLLYKVDPDLSKHLKNIEVLPQIFLIRWIRLLFSREFPFDQMLVLWDTLFSVDPSLDLIDLVCTAMLLRIRWDLLEADYSVALQLLLKYPPPQAPHGPHTFVDDAVYLKNHLNPEGGSTLVMKYTGRQPAPATASSRPTTPKSPSIDTKRNARGSRSPLSPSRFPTSFLQQPGGVEALFQGAAKGILQRSEKLGVNQAVRDALVEIRRNVSEARSTMKVGRDLFSETGPNSTAMQAVAALDRRNKQLAAMLDETVANLRALASSEMDDKKKHAEALEIAAAKVQFVKIYLEDSTVALPEDEQPKDTSVHGAEDEGPEMPTDAVSAMVISTPEIGVDSPGLETSNIVASTPAALAEQAEQGADMIPDAMDTDPLSTSRTATPTQPKSLQRPPAPIPTRSTLAQSSFAWMLEPDQSASTATSQKPTSFDSSSKPKPANKHHKKPSANANRERTAFLFGEVPSGADDVKGILPEDIFGLQPMGKSKERGRLWDD